MPPRVKICSSYNYKLNETLRVVAGAAIGAVLGSERFGLVATIPTIPMYRS